MEWTEVGLRGSKKQERKTGNGKKQKNEERKNEEQEKLKGIMEENIYGRGEK